MPQTYHRTSGAFIASMANAIHPKLTSERMHELINDDDQLRSLLTPMTNPKPLKSFATARLGQWHDGQSAVTAVSDAKIGVPTFVGTQVPFETEPSYADLVCATAEDLGFRAAPSIRGLEMQAEHYGAKLSAPEVAVDLVLSHPALFAEGCQYAIAMTPVDIPGSSEMSGILSICRDVHGLRIGSIQALDTTSKIKAKVDGWILTTVRS